jgi:hypothetical protein
MYAHVRMYPHVQCALAFAHTDIAQSHRSPEVGRFSPAPTGKVYHFFLCALFRFLRSWLHARANSPVHPAAFSTDLNLQVARSAPHSIAILVYSRDAMSSVPTGHTCVSHGCHRNKQCLYSHRMSVCAWRPVEATKRCPFYGRIEAYLVPSISAGSSSILAYSR